MRKIGYLAIISGILVASIEMLGLYFLYFFMIITNFSIVRGSVMRDVSPFYLFTRPLVIIPFLLDVIVILIGVYLIFNDKQEIDKSCGHSKINQI